MKTVLVTGSRGQLGSELQQLVKSYSSLNFIFTDVDELDITSKEQIDKFVSLHSVDYIVNCAAYTAVDAAEDNVDACYAINRDAVKNIGEVAKKHNVKVIHVSTDYVFDGKNHIPYTEDMSVAPESIYGKSKLAGELLLQEVCPQSVIIRTSWLYSSFGNNFVKTMIRLGQERDNLNVVFDQIGTPTYARDLARVIMHILSFEAWNSGLYHFSNEGVCSWYDFTKTIHRIADITCNVQPILSKDYPTKATRPFYSVLNKEKIKKVYNIQIPHWEKSLEECIGLLLRK